MLTYKIFHLDNFGDVGIVSSEEGLYRIFLRPKDQNEIFASLPIKEVRKIEEDTSKNALFFEQIREYWEGRRKEFNLPLDWTAVSSAFEKKVLKTLKKVPFGKTISYQKLAEMVGNPGAARAIGGAMSRNPFPIVIPCHRVLRKNGKLGGYTGGIEIKKMLLNLEGIL